MTTKCDSCNPTGVFDVDGSGPWNCPDCGRKPEDAQKWQMVPVELTDDMVVAFAEAWYSKRQSFDDPDMVDAYRDMLAVAPECPDAHLIAAAPALLEDLKVAAALLRKYETLHRAKGTDESTAKAEVNAELAGRFERTITLATLDTNEQSRL